MRAATVALVMLTALSASAKKEKFFLDAKCQLVGIATIGNPFWDENTPKKFVRMDITSRFDIPESLVGALSDAELETYLNENNVGRRVIDHIVSFDGYSLHDGRLRQLAMQNAIRADRERADKGLIDASTMLKDDIDPIFLHNYLIVNRTKTVPAKQGDKDVEKVIGNRAIYKVVMTPELLEQIYAAWDNPEEYQKIFVPVQYIAPLGMSVHETTKELGKTEPDFMLYGQMLSRATVDLPRSIGINKGYDVTIYRQELDRDGNFYSKRIARGKVSGFDDDGEKTHFFRVAGNAGSRKNGDLVTIKHSNNFSWGIYADYMPHVWGGNFQFDWAGVFRKSGLYAHFLMDLGFHMTDKPGNKYIIFDRPSNYEYRSPMFFNIGMGAAFSKTFIGMIETTPFFMVEYEPGFMAPSKLEDIEGEKSQAPFGNAVRVPVGLRLNINLNYPFRLSLEAGYAFHWGFGDDYKIIEQTCNYLDAKRKGFFLSAGFMF